MRTAAAAPELEPDGQFHRPPGQRQAGRGGVAELAASGMTTADVAAQLCVSVKTVQANMTQIYRKLGIHSRAELGRLMGRASGQ